MFLTVDSKSKFILNSTKVQMPPLWILLVVLQALVATLII